MYQKGSDVLSHTNYGMYGCWQPALELGLVLAVHIRVPQFGAANKHDEAKRAVYQALADQRKLNVWNCILDMHCSDIDGTRKEDFQHDTHGCIVMCKFMVNATEQLAELEVIARGCDSQNPFTHTLHKWTVEMQSNARIKQFAKSKDEPKPTNAIFYNGVECKGEHVIEDLDQRAMDNAGLPSWTSASTAHAVQQKAQGLEQLVLVSEFTCVFSEFTLHRTLSSWMEPECVEQLFGQPLMNIGRMILQGDMQGCNKFLIIMFAKAAADGMLPQGLRLVEAISTFAMHAHLDSNIDEHAEHVKHQLAWATFRKMALPLTATPM